MALIGPKVPNPKCPILRPGERQLGSKRTQRVLKEREGCGGRNRGSPFGTPSGKPDSAK
jgi:hypothetical protein